MWRLTNVNSPFVGYQDEIMGHNNIRFSCPPPKLGLNHLIQVIILNESNVFIPVIDQKLFPTEDRQKSNRKQIRNIIFKI